MGASLIGVLARLRLLVLVGLLALQFAPATDAVAQALQPVPPLAARVNDLTGTLDTATQARLESKLEACERRKGSQVVLLMVPTTAPEAIEAFAIRVADDWKIGRSKVDGQKVDDGVLLLVAKDDRRLRIEVGYGLEGAIPDARAKQVIENLISPRFRQGDFAGGVEAGLDAVMKLIDGEPLPAPSRGAQPADGGGDGGWLAMLLGAFFVALIVRQLLGRVLGSSLGAAVGGGMTWLAGSGLLLAAGAGVLIFALLLAMASGGGMGQVGRHTWRSGPGGLPGGFGGGRRGGRGGLGGGGFRGGGGGFGGGGASGGW